MITNHAQVHHPCRYTNNKNIYPIPPPAHQTLEWQSKQIIILPITWLYSSTLRCLRLSYETTIRCNFQFAISIPSEITLMGQLSYQGINSRFSLPKILRQTIHQSISMKEQAFRKLQKFCGTANKRRTFWQK